MLYRNLNNNLKLNIMKSEITYKGKQIIECTNGYFTAYPSNYSSNTAKSFKTLNGAKKHIDKYV